MHVHPKASGLEAHISNALGKSRKKPPNPDEVGPVKDHFSDGRQQDTPRQPVKRARSPQAEAEPARFKDAAPPPPNPDESQRQAALALYALAQKAVPDLGAAPKPPDLSAAPAQAKEPSLDELLALMLRKI